MTQRRSSGANLHSAEPASGGGLREITQKLLAGLIENEINAAFIFLAVARESNSALNFSEGNSALSKAEAIYVQASELARDASGEAQLAFADRLRELRLAIDGLRSSGDSAI